MNAPIRWTTYDDEPGPLYRAAELAERREHVHRPIRLVTLHRNRCEVRIDYCTTVRQGGGDPAEHVTVRLWLTGSDGQTYPTQYGVRILRDELAAVHEALAHALRLVAAHSGAERGGYDGER